MSAVSARVKSNVKVQKISWGAKAVGITLSKEEAVQLARNLADYVLDGDGLH